MPTTRTARKGTRKTTRKAAGRKSTRKAARKSAVRSGARRTARKAAAKRRPAARRPAPKRTTTRPPAPPAIRKGTITHTELASADPLATRAWCEDVLGWKFGEAVPTPTGPYHMWRFPNDTGGGIRATNPAEPPGTTPYCEVEDIRATYAKALAAGATEMVPPMALPEGMGWIAIVAAPGGVAIGFWSMK